MCSDWTGARRWTKLIDDAERALAEKDAGSFHEARKDLMRLGFEFSSTQSPELRGPLNRRVMMCEMALEIAREFKLPRASKDTVCPFYKELSALSSSLVSADTICAFGRATAHTSLLLGALTGCNTNAYAPNEEYEGGKAACAKFQKEIGQNRWRLPFAVSPHGRVRVDSMKGSRFLDVQLGEKAVSCFKVVFINFPDGVDQGECYLSASSTRTFCDIFVARLPSQGSLESSD